MSRWCSTTELRAYWRCEDSIVPAAPTSACAVEPRRAAKDSGSRWRWQAPGGELTLGFHSPFRSQLRPLGRTGTARQIIRCHDAGGDFELELAQLIELIARQCRLLELEIDGAPGPLS